MNDIIQNTYVYFSIDTLEYLEKGGRIGKATAFVGSALKIKPILSFDKDNGTIYVPAKVRGNKKVKAQLIKLISKHIEENPERKFNIIVAALSTYLGSGLLGAGIQFID